MKREESSAPGAGRLVFLDGLRGVAALFVVLHHFHGAFLARELPTATVTRLLGDSPLSILTNGGFCVFTFFVLSGFVLAESVAKGITSLPARVIARYFRLTVPMLASLVFAWVLLHLFAHSRDGLARLEPGGWFRAVSLSGQAVPTFLRAIQDGLYGAYLTGMSTLNPVVWTMRKELFGSLAIYVVYWFASDRFRLPVLALFFVVALWGPDYLGFPIGAILRECWAKGWLRKSNASWLAFAVAMIVACDLRIEPPGVASNLDAARAFLGRYEAYFDSIGAGLLVYAILTLLPLQHALASSITRFLGRISFALYLVHLPLICTAILWLDLNTGGPSLLKAAGLLIALLACSISTAWLMTIALDEPLMARLHAVKRLSGLTKRKGAEANASAPHDNNPLA